MKIDVLVADENHFRYAEEIVRLMGESSSDKGTVLAVRTPEYIKDKIESHKAVIALTDKDLLAGFSYIETWSHSKFVANSGLIVAQQYRNTGLARRIKRKIFELSRQMYPYAKIFSITTNLAVMKINSELGFRPVTIASLTDDKEFWEGCRGCRNYDILLRNGYKMCLCTALLYDPKEHPQEKQKSGFSPIRSVGNLLKGLKLF